MMDDAKPGGLVGTSTHPRFKDRMAMGCLGGFAATVLTYLAVFLFYVSFFFPSSGEFETLGGFLEVLYRLGPWLPAPIISLPLLWVFFRMRGMPRAGRGVTIAISLVFSVVLMLALLYWRMISA